jgi:hypothetical protein
MMSLNWSCVETAARLLERDERDAVVGDLTEAGASAWEALLGVLGLVVRRETRIWKSWRPWLASFGLALPCSFLLMGFSLSVSSSCLHLAGLMLSTNAPNLGTESLNLISHISLLIAWSWTGGFVVGSLSRRTIWVSIACAFLPCLFCLSRFREPSLPRLCLLLFLAPAIWGVYCGLKRMRIRIRTATLLALAVTMLMISASNAGMWTLNWLLIWPAWYIALTAIEAAKTTAAR